MRWLIAVGIALIALGAFIAFRGGSFTSRRDVIKVGDFKVTADERQSIPPWAGGVAVAVGIALVAAGGRRRA